MTPETRLKIQIRKAVNRIDVKRVRIVSNVVGVLYDDRGVPRRVGLGKGSPDFVGIAWGVPIGLEVKSARGRVSREQPVWGRSFANLGGRYAVVRSVEEAVRFVMEPKK